MTDEDALQAAIDAEMVSREAYHLGEKVVPHRGRQTPRLALYEFLDGHADPRAAGYLFLARHELIPMHERQWPMGWDAARGQNQLVRPEGAKPADPVARWEWWDHDVFDKYDETTWQGVWGCVLPHALFGELTRTPGAVVYRNGIYEGCPLFDPARPNQFVDNSCDFYTRRAADDAAALAFARLPAETQQHLMECPLCRCGIKPSTAPTSRAATSPSSR